MNFEKLAPMGTSISQNEEVLKETREEVVIQACIMCLFTATLPIRAVQESNLGSLFNSGAVNLFADRLSAVISNIKSIFHIYMQKKIGNDNFFLHHPVPYHFTYANKYSK